MALSNVPDTSVVRHPWNAETLSVLVELSCGVRAYAAARLDRSAVHERSLVAYRNPVT